MTHQAKTFIEAILMDCRANPDIPPKNVIAAIILGTRHAGYSQEDFREMMKIARVEFGAAPKTWEMMTVDLLGELPHISKANAEDLSRQ